MLLIAIGAVAIASAGTVAFVRLSQLLPIAQTQQTGPTGSDLFDNLNGPAATMDSDPADLALQARADLDALAAFLDARLAAGSLPQSLAELTALWEQATGELLPLDPFDGLNYGYDVDGDTHLLWSSGPDGESGTADDISATNQR